MNNNLEIEFKTLITKEKYIELMNYFNLDGVSYLQTNHYFDTPDLKLKKDNKMLRIRCKEQTNSYKLTLKERQDKSCLETHVILNKEDVSNMIKNGFDASIIELDYNVVKICDLTTLRAKTPYKNGTLFLDKSTYSSITEYEIEYEVDEYEAGKKAFEKLLDDLNITKVDSISKSARAFKEYYKKQKKD